MITTLIYSGHWPDKNRILGSPIPTPEEYKIPTEILSYWFLD